MFAHPRIDYIEIPMTYKLAGSSFRGSQHALFSGSQTTPWGITMVKAPEVWHVATGQGARIMVIDTGMENHVDLPDRPSSNCGGTHDGCSDGPIYHGTHVSGITLARDDDKGVVGVAPGLDDYAVFSWGACSPVTGLCSDSEIAAGIDQANASNVDVINMSLAGRLIEGGVLRADETGGITLNPQPGNSQPSSEVWDPA